MVDFLVLALQIYLYVVFIWVVLSWIPLPWGHPVRRFHDFLDRLVRPVLAPIDRMIPPARVGGVGIGFGPIILTLLIIILISILD